MVKQLIFKDKIDKIDDKETKFDKDYFKELETNENNLVLIGSRSHDYVNYFRKPNLFIYNDFYILFALEDLLNNKKTDIDIEIKGSDVYINDKRVILVYSVYSLSQVNNDISLGLEIRNTLRALIDIISKINLNIIIELIINRDNYNIFKDMIILMGDFNIRFLIVNSFVKLRKPDLSMISELKDRIKIFLVESYKSETQSKGLLNQRINNIFDSDLLDFFSKLND